MKLPDQCSLMHCSGHGANLEHQTSLKIVVQQHLFCCFGNCFVATSSVDQPAFCQLPEVVSTHLSFGSTDPFQVSERRSHRSESIAICVWNLSRIWNFLIDHFIDLAMGLFHWICNRSCLPGGLMDRQPTKWQERTWKACSLRSGYHLLSVCQSTKTSGNRGRDPCL